MVLKSYSEVLTDWCSVAGLELVGGIFVTSEELTELINVLDASASIRPVFIEIFLDFTFLFELSGSEVNSSDEVIDVDSTGGNSTSQGIQTLDHVFAQGRGSSGQRSGNQESGNIDKFGNQILGSTNNAIVLLLDGSVKIYASGVSERVSRG
jgi:hypothetical protein